MKIRPVILCGGAGTRLWNNKKKNQAKQFIDFGGWTLLEKSFKRIKNTIFDTPIISTNKQYLKEIKKNLKKHKIYKYKIILEPIKKNTAPAILSAALLNCIPQKQPMLFFSADHLIEKLSKFNREIKKNKKYLSGKNIFIFGIKPNTPSNQFGYFITNNIKKNVKKVSKFIEKPNELKAKQIIKKGAYWNAGIFFIRKDSIIYNYKKYQKKTYLNCFSAVKKSKLRNNIYFLNKREFRKNTSKSFDYAILEKLKDINAIKLNLPWSDLGSWKEICLYYNKHKKKFYNKKNVFYRPWGRYVNLYKGKNFLIKELYVKHKGILSLQKHHHRAEHWVITQGQPKITLNKKSFCKKANETIFIPKGAIHRIANPHTVPVKIIEAQIGSILKESDIVRFKDIYGRVK